MPFQQLLIKCGLFLSSFVSLSAFGQQRPIALHPENPHYFIYNDKPTILITSGEHYGAVLNLDFDYEIYLDELQAHSLNLTRTFSGAYVEPQGSFNIAQNTLAPDAGKFICPWQRSNTPGYANGGNKFDLSKWDGLYFKRLKKFVAAAEKRNIIIELTFFCPFYENIQWDLSPMNTKNNINNVGDIDRNDVYALDKSKGLLQIQDALIRKIVSELKNFSNIMYEICNEPYFGVTMEWQHHMATVITDAEKSFRYKHLITQNISNGSMLVRDPAPNVSVFNFHYANPPVAVAQNYHLKKVIGDNETGFRGNADSTYRREGWQFILSGGGLFNNLDYSFTAEHENGTFAYPPTQPGGGSTSLRKQLGYLKKFIFGFDFIHMEPDSTSIIKKSPEATIYMLSEPGKQYVMYISGGKEATVEMIIPKGTYSIQWFFPETGEYQKSMVLPATQRIKFKTPEYEMDIAVRIVQMTD